ncbi:hypothetical protein AB28_5496 [Raoultella ornithinolytica 2-156-04_S1_C2]|nr:hypothetical protein AB28_5496 [Raoultella ornithinolytica 2-156-04_S1_C2]
MYSDNNNPILGDRICRYHKNNIIVIFTVAEALRYYRDNVSMSDIC